MEKSLAFLFILPLMLAACIPKNNSPSLSTERLTVSIQEKSSTLESYLVEILTNGIQNGHVASLPQAMSIIVKKGQFEMDVTIGAAYTLKIYRTDYDSIEGMYKGLKEEPAGAGEPEDPLITYSFTAEEEMKSLKLNSPPKD